MSMLRWLVAGVLAFGFMPTAVFAQADKSEKVRITTIDSVELIGNFYPCTDPKVKNPPVVLMLHPLGENSQKKDWVGLAESLQSKFAVMTFDFRGHGNSTEILPETFFRYPANKTGVKGSQTRTSIEFKDFEKGYYPAIVNDIAAVKGYLDRKNDTGACNTSSFIVIGAGDGATLGAIWLSSEWHRFRLVQNPMFIQMQPDNRAEANDVIGFIGLNITSNLGSRTVSLANTLDLSLRQKAIPMAFFHSDEDKSGMNVANNLIKGVKSLKDKEKYAYTLRIPVGKAGKLTGSGLLQKSLGTREAIMEYLEKVVDAKGREWAEHEFRKTSFVWRYPLNAPNYIIAKPTNDNNIVFDPYVRFMR